MNKAIKVLQEKVTEFEGMQTYFSNELLKHKHATADQNEIQRLNIGKQHAIEVVNECLEAISKLEPATATTETFMDRLIAERDQLSDRLLKLEVFLSDKENAAKISGPTQVAMLIEQHHHMFKYLNILDKRIEDLAPKESN